MRSLTLFLLVSIASGFAQVPNVRDPQAIEILTWTVNALGGIVPSDSVANGSFQRIAGSTSDNGTIVILTRGYSQTAEMLTIAGASSQLTFSQGYAAEKDASGVKRLPLEHSLSCDSAVFPLLPIAAVLQDASASLQVVGTETLAGISTYHLRLWRIPNDENFAGLWEFSRKDIWIAAGSGLPLKLAYEMRDGGGGAARIPVELFFSDYRSVGGVMYPFLIGKNINGTPYMTVRISSVAFNSGLTDQTFALK